MLQPSNHKLTALCLLTLIALTTVGCSSSAPMRVDANNDPDAATSYGIDYEDWQDKASVMAQSLISSGALDNINNPPAVLMIDKFRNKSGEQLDIQRLTDTMRIALNRTGKAQTSFRYNLGNRSEAAGAEGIDQEAEFFADAATNASKAKAPDFTLSGVITKDYIRAKRTRQTTYVIKLSLARTGGQGVFVWEDQVVIRKRGKKAGVSF